MIKKTALYGALILCTLLLVTCTTDEESMIGPFGDASKYISATKITVKTMNSLSTVTQQKLQLFYWIIAVHR
jgi:hypothetical protein